MRRSPSQCTVLWIPSLSVVVLLFVLYPEKRYINVTNYYLLWLLYVADLLICLNPVSVLYLRNYGLVVHCFRWISHLSVSGLEMELIRYVFLLSDHRSGGFFHGWPSEVFYASVSLRESGEIIESWRHAFSSSQCWLHSVSLPSLNSSSPLPQNPRQSRCKSNRSVQLVVLEVHYQMLQWPISGQSCPKVSVPLRIFWAGGFGQRKGGWEVV